MSCGFNKTDLQNIVNIIEVCTKRGAFHAEEMIGIGQLYDKLKKSLNCCNQPEPSVDTVTEGVEKTLDVCDIGECKDGVCPISNCGT